MHKFCTAGCRSTVRNCDVYSREGNKQVLVPSTGIFHLILQICFWGIFISLCQRPCRAKESGAKGPFYHLTCPPPLAKTHRVDFAKCIIDFANFSINFHGAVLSPRLAQAEVLRGSGWHAWHLSAKSNTSPWLAALQQKNPHPVPL